MTIVLLVLTLFCALQAIRSPHLLNAVLWLAGVSALVSLMLYTIGAWQIAVIELSIGAGLVTVLMVFAITMVGNEREPITSYRSSFPLLLMSILLLTLLTVPFVLPPQVDAQSPLSDVLWQERGLDMVLQVALIFSGILGVIGLLSASQSVIHRSQDFSTVDETQLSEANFNVADETKEAA